MKVKVCGIRTETDVRICTDAGADLLGFLVADVESPRAIGPSDASDLVELVPGGGPETVAVDASKDPYDALDKLERVGADLLQMHRGDLGGKDLADLAGSCRLIQVAEVRDGVPEVAVEGDYLLLDTNGERPGGTGRTHDWELSRRFVEECPSPVILAGGLGPDNVKEAAETVRPDAVDAASRLDGDEGKDPEAVGRFVQNAKDA